MDNNAEDLQPDVGLWGSRSQQPERWEPCPERQLGGAMWAGLHARWKNALPPSLRRYLARTLGVVAEARASSSTGSKGRR